MSDPSLQPPPAPPRKRSRLVAALMVLSGLILLLPGLCVLVTGVTTIPWLIDGLRNNPSAVTTPYFWPTLGLWVVFWAVCLLISWGGIRLIMRALR